MRKTLALVGLFFAGLGLLLSPRTGILGPTVVDPVAGASSAGTVATSGEPPPETGLDDPTVTTTLPATVPSTTVTPSTTTTTTAPAVSSVVGPAVGTEYGYFQVEIVVAGNRLVDIVALQLPGDRRSRSINNQAVPLYEAAALDAQSAAIDLISGATITWRAYTSSLQAALDEAGI